MFGSGKFRLAITSLMTVVTLGFGVFVQALQADIRNPSSTYVVTFEYFNENSQDTTFFVAGMFDEAVGNSALKSGAILEIAKIEHTYPMSYTAARGLETITSGSYSTQTAAINPTDASYINSDNKLSFVITPNNDNRCSTTADTKGCVWDGQKLNQWNADNQSCFGGEKMTCESNKFVATSTNILSAKTGGKISLTVKIKGTVEKEQYLYFPLKTYQYTPAAPVKKSLSLTSGVSVLLTDRAVASFSAPTSSSSSSSVSSSSSSASVSSVSSSVSSSTSSVSSSSQSSVASSSQPAVVPSITALTNNDVPALDLYCADVIGGKNTNCTFTLPAGKSFPTEGVKVTITETGKPAICTAKGKDVTCAQVSAPTKVGSQPIYIAVGPSAMINSFKKVNVLASETDVVRTGAGEIATLYVLAVFAILVLIAFIVVHQQSKVTNLRL